MVANPRAPWRKVEGLLMNFFCITIVFRIPGPRDWEDRWAAAPQPRRGEGIAEREAGILSYPAAFTLASWSALIGCQRDRPDRQGQTDRLREEGELHSKTGRREGHPFPQQAAAAAAASA